MTSALNQGRAGGAAHTLAPSTRALGPNTYLSGRDFLIMIVVAFLVHAAVITIMALWPNTSVKNIPVRALSFKLGNSDPMRSATATTRLPPAPFVPPKAMQQALPAPKPTPAPAAKAKPTFTKPVAKPPAVAPTPQQYVRQVGAAPTAPQAADSANEQMIRARYEQEISLWIQRHKLYPVEAGGREGRVVVRVRIDRAGNVRYYAIEQTSGMQALDDGALDMIRRANPVPAVPTGYPAANLVEFLIPITFKAPQ